MRTHIHSSRGFTLIELITAITIMALLSTVGIASFVNYSRSQQVFTATQNVVTALQLAKANASSQVKPASCASETLSGYHVSIDANGNTYALEAVCGESVDVSSRKTHPLGQSVMFSPGGTQTVFFRTVTGDVVITQPGTTIQIEHTDIDALNDGGSLTKTITVETDGRIHVE